MFTRSEEQELHQKLLDLRREVRLACLRSTGSTSIPENEQIEAWLAGDGEMATVQSRPLNGHGVKAT